jgi:hypothetical protein
MHVPGKWLAKCVLLAGPWLLAIRSHPCHRADCRGASGLRLVRGAKKSQTPSVIANGAVVPFGTLRGMQTIPDESIDTGGR